MHSNLRILYILIFITAVTGGVWLYTQPAGQLTSIEGTDFAVDDTSTIDKIFIADMDGVEVTLSRPERGRLWDLNGKYKAREDAVKLLLKETMKIY